MYRQSTPGEVIITDRALIRGFCRGFPLEWSGVGVATG